MGIAFGPGSLFLSSVQDTTAIPDAVRQRENKGNVISMS